MRATCRATREQHTTYTFSLCVFSPFFAFQGGLKAAILSDVIQGLAMIGVSVVIIVQGTVNVGGPANVLNVTYERGRLDFFKYDRYSTRFARFVSMIRARIRFRRRVITHDATQHCGISRCVFLRTPR